MLDNAQQAIANSLSFSGDIYLEQRKRLTDRQCELMEKILIDNAHKSKYWILGMAKTKRKNGRTTITPFMSAYDEIPKLIKESYVYEVDNTTGKRTLLWVFHPNNQLMMPSIGKSISVADKTGVNNLVAEVTGALRE